MSADRAVTDGPILPRYAGQSLLNVPASVCAALGVPTAGLPPALDAAVLPPALLDGVRAVCLLIVDGLGRQQLDAALGAGDAPTISGLRDGQSFGSAAHDATITSVVPSSTMPALATLSTGLPPSEHGLLGWTVYLEEFGEAAELARWGPAAERGSYLQERLGGHDPVAFFGRETLYQRLRRSGVRSVAICPAHHRGTGFSEMVFQGAELPGYYATSSILPMVERLLAERADRERLYLYAYWPTLDTVGHHDGPLGPEHAAELAVLDFSLGRWLRTHRPRGDLLLLLTADHGHVPTDRARVVRLDRPMLLEALRSPPTGERRLAYLHARPGRAGAVRAYCAERLSEVAELVEPTVAFERGLFGTGEVSGVARRRAGDLILLAREDHQFVCPFIEGEEPDSLIGNHGALDSREMLVPLLALRV